MDQYEQEMKGDGSILVTLDPWFDGHRHSRMSLEWNWCLRRYIWVNMWNDEMKFCWWVNWVRRDSLDSVYQAPANQSTVRLFAQVLVVLCQNFCQRFQVVNFTPKRKLSIQRAIDFSLECVYITIFNRSSTDLPMSFGTLSVKLRSRCPRHGYSAPQCGADEWPTLQIGSAAGANASRVEGSP